MGENFVPSLSFGLSVWFALAEAMRADMRQTEVWQSILAFPLTFLAFAVKHVWVNLLVNETPEQSWINTVIPGDAPDMWERPAKIAWLPDLPVANRSHVNAPCGAESWMSRTRQPACRPWTKTNVYCLPLKFWGCLLCSTIGTIDNWYKMKLLFSYTRFKEEIWAQNIVDKNCTYSWYTTWYFETRIYCGLAKLK